MLTTNTEAASAGYRRRMRARGVAPTLILQTYRVALLPVNGYSKVQCAPAIAAIRQPPRACLSASRSFTNCLTMLRPRSRTATKSI